LNFNQWNEEAKILFPDFLSDLTGKERELLYSMSVREQHRKGKIIFHEKDLVKHFWLILSGGAFLFSMLPEGRRVLLSIFSEGEFFGLETLNRHLFTCQAVSPLTALRFDRKTLVELTEQIPPLRNHLIKSYLHRLLRARSQIMILARKSPNKRVALFLLHLTLRQQGAGLGKGFVEIPFSRREIGDFLALAPETVSRNFKKLARNGIIDLITPRRILILDPEKLHAIAMDDAGFTPTEINYESFDIF